MRRLAVTFALVIGLAVSVAGCGQMSSRGSGTHGVARAALCTYHGWRLVHDVRHGYNGFALFQAFALKHCLFHHHR